MSFSLRIRSPEEIAAEAARAHAAEIVTAIDARVEACALSMGYNSAANCAGYANSTVPSWVAEAAAFIAWRDRVWAAAFDVQARHAAAGTLPTIAEVLEALPTWED